MCVNRKWTAALFCFSAQCSLKVDWMKSANEVCQRWCDIWTERQINFLRDKGKMLISLRTDSRVLSVNREHGCRIVKNVFTTSRGFFASGCFHTSGLCCGGGSVAFRQSLNVVNVHCFTQQVGQVTGCGFSSQSDSSWWRQEPGSRSSRRSSITLLSGVECTSFWLCQKQANCTSIRLYCRYLFSLTNNSLLLICFVTVILMCLSANVTKKKILVSDWLAHLC